MTRYALTHGTPHSGPQRKRLTPKEKYEQKKLWNELVRISEEEEKRKSKEARK